MNQATETEPKNSYSNLGESKMLAPAAGASPRGCTELCDTSWRNWFCSKEIRSSYWTLSKKTTKKHRLTSHKIKQETHSIEVHTDGYTREEESWKKIVAVGDFLFYRGTVAGINECLYLLCLPGATEKHLPRGREVKFCWWGVSIII